jgi:hypothetical protein
MSEVILTQDQVNSIDNTNRIVVKMPDGRHIKANLEVEILRINKLGGLEVSPDFTDRGIYFHPVPTEYWKYDNDHNEKTGEFSHFWAGMEVKGFFGRTRDTNKKDKKSKSIFVRPFIPVEVIREIPENEVEEITEVLMPDGRKMIVKLIPEELQQSKMGTLEVAPEFTPEGVFFHPIPKKFLDEAQGLEIGTKVKGFFGRSRDTGKKDTTGTPIFVRPFIPVRW